MVSSALGGCFGLGMDVSGGAVWSCCGVWTRHPVPSCPPPASADWAQSSPHQNVKDSFWVFTPCSSSLWDQMENGKGRINTQNRAGELDQPLGFGSWVGTVLSGCRYFLPCWISSLNLIFSSPHCWFKGVSRHFSSQELFSMPFSFWFTHFPLLTGDER